MANKKKDPCTGCAADHCKTCENKAHKALTLKDVHDASKQVATEVLIGDLPYSKEAYIAQARFYAARTAEDMLTLGKILTVLREKEGYGGFVKLVEEEIGISHTVAYRFMNTALKAEKFPKLDFSQWGKLSNVYAILEAPDEDLKELEDKGILAGKDIEDLQRMSVKEMREMIKKLKTDTDKIIKEEVKALETEKKSLVKEVERLKAFEPKGIDEDVLAKLTSLDDTLEHADKLLRSIVFGSEDLGDDTFARINGICKRIRDRFELFEENYFNMRDDA